ncbi:MAG TPA: hypothetical protein DCL15_22690 [Chloroflexi bacterium]|nr:hypothetical protein [Chloroflexota bacterium]HHW86491.1 hypothetical protein [Chloroflexota bacterium]
MNAVNVRRPVLHLSIFPSPNLVPRLLALIIILLAFALRLHRLDFQELRGDEAFGYFFAQRDYVEIIDATIALQEPHPVASYFVLRAWLGVAGDRELALRFPSVWFGVLAVALLLRLAQRIAFPRGPALLAMALLAISPYAIWHAQDARMYSMSLALTTATVWLGVETLQRQRAAWGLAYVGAAWLALHTHYYAAFVLAGLNLFVLTRAIFLPRMRANLPMWMMWQLLAAAAYLPWLASAATIVGNYGGNGDSPTFAAMASRALAALAVGESIPPAQRVPLAFVAATLLAIGAVRLLTGSAADRRNLWLLSCYLAVPVLATWWSAQHRPIFNERYLVASAPPFYLLVGAALAGKRRDGWRAFTGRWLALAALAVLVAGMMLSLAHHYADPAFSKTRGWRALAAALERLSADLPPAQVRIAQNYPDPTLWYYYRGSVEHIMLPPAAHDAAGAQQQMMALVEADVRRILLPVQPSPNWDDHDLARAALTNSPYDLVYEQPVGVWPLQVYAGQPFLNEERALNVVFENGFFLGGVSNLHPSRATPGGLLTPTLFGARPPSDELGALKLTVQLLDGAGRLVTQQDLPLTAWHLGNARNMIRTYGLSLPAELAPGAYRLIAALYDAGADGAPRVRTVTGEDTVELAVVHVE